MKIQLGILLVVVLVCLAVPVAVWHRAQAHWRDKNALLHRQTERLKRLLAENQRLSNRLAQAKAPDALTQKQFEELLQLRGEYAPLRQAAAEADRLRAANKRLEVARARARAEARTTLPAAGKVQAYWPKALLTFAGYSNPLSGLKTALWAMSRDDPKALAACMTPKAKAKLMKRGWASKKDGWTSREGSKSELASSAKMIAESLQPSTGFYVVGQKNPAPDWAILDVYFAGEGETRKVGMKKIGGAWKFAVMDRGSSKDDRVTKGYGIWP